MLERVKNDIQKKLQVLEYGYSFSDKLRNVPYVPIIGHNYSSKYKTTSVSYFTLFET